MAEHMIMISSDEEDVTKLKKLINDYDFKMDTISNYLGLSIEQLKKFLDGESLFPNDKRKFFQISDKINLLYYSTEMEKDIELEGFLTVLVQFHGISTTSIAKISGVSLQDVENCMEHKFDQVSDDAKYKIAITAIIPTITAAIVIFFFFGSIFFLALTAFSVVCNSFSSIISLSLTKLK